MNQTLIVIILDESFSMFTKKELVIKGFNKFIDDQKAIKEDDARVILVKFSDYINEVIGSKDLKDFGYLSHDNFKPDGNTALCDAVGRGIFYATLAKCSKERVVFLIITDGEENCSEKTSKSQIRQLIEDKREKDEWTFLYIGEGPEKWARDTGMDVTDGIQYDHHNPEKSFTSTSKVLSGFRKSNQRKAKNLFQNYY